MYVLCCFCFVFVVCILPCLQFDWFLMRLPLFCSTFYLFDYTVIHYPMLFCSVLFYSVLFCYILFCFHSVPFDAVIWITINAFFKTSFLFFLSTLTTLKQYAPPHVDGICDQVRSDLIMYTYTAHICIFISSLTILTTRGRGCRRGEQGNNYNKLKTK